MSFQESAVEVIDTNLTKIPNKAQFVFENPLKARLFVNSIQLSFDPYFSEKGALLIKINGNPILNKNAGSFKRLQNFTVPMQNQEFLQQQKIEIFAWNGIDTDFVSLGMDIQVSEDPEKPVTSDTPLSEALRNSAISEPQILFEVKNYVDETVTKLLNMKGYKKLIVNMAAQNYVAPVIKTNDYTVNPTNIIDGDLATFAGLGSPVTPYTKEVIIDFGSIAIRHLKSKGHAFRPDGSSTQTISLDYSDDDISYTSGDFHAFPINALPQTKTLDSGSVSFRYARHRIVITGAIGGLDNRCYEVYDADVFGGTASLSFEELDIASSLFSELIASTEFGTVTSGNAVKTSIGDVNNVSVSGKSYFLPSTQNGFRAKLVIVGGGLNTGVSIRRIL